MIYMSTPQEILDCVSVCVVLDECDQRGCARAHEDDPSSIGVRGIQHVLSVHRIEVFANLDAEGGRGRGEDEGERRGKERERERERERKRRRAKCWIFPHPVTQMDRTEKQP